MRRALPNAAFIGFTGTPLIAGQEERTREVFGDYVSIYNFAPVDRRRRDRPALLREPHPRAAARRPTSLKDELDALLEEAELDEEQEKKLERDVRPRVPPHHPRRPAGRDRRGPRAPLRRRGAIAARRWSSPSTRRPPCGCTTRCEAQWAAELAELRGAARRGSRARREPALAERLDWMRDDRHGGRRQPGAERDRRPEAEGPRHPAAPRADAEGGPRRASSRTPTTRSGSCSSARCG